MDEIVDEVDDEEDIIIVAIVDEVDVSDNEIVDELVRVVDDEEDDELDELEVLEIMFEFDEWVNIALLIDKLTDMLDEDDELLVKQRLVVIVELCIVDEEGMLMLSHRLVVELVADSLE